MGFFDFNLPSLDFDLDGCTNPDEAFAVTFLVFLGVSTLCFVTQAITRDCSFVDRFWSVIPVVYAWIYVGCTEADTGNARLLVSAILISIWGLRLTLNFVRRGGYGALAARLLCSGDDVPDGTQNKEDYRWAVLRKKFQERFGERHRVYWEIFNLVFISFYQQYILWLLVSPMYFISLAATEQGSRADFDYLDYIAAVLFVIFLVAETVCDQQQWVFQNEKYRLRAEAPQDIDGDYALGFCTSGVFKYSRHLNFFSEQSMWWMIYVFSIAASGSYVNWSIFGAGLLSSLFYGSARFTEEITLQKYPAYARYQKTTSRMLPLWAGEPVVPTAEELELARSGGAKKANESAV